MITCRRHHLQLRAIERGYTLEEVSPCIVRELANGFIAVDPDHPAYPLATRADAGGPGTELKALLALMGIKPREGGCKCKDHAAKMNRQGPEWCRKNLGIILHWLELEAKNRKMPFVRIVAEKLVLRAIKNAERKAGG